MFLGVKAYEYHHLYHEHLVPGQRLRPIRHAERQPAAARSSTHARVRKAPPDLLLVLLRHDRRPRPAHGDRHRRVPLTSIWLAAPRPVQRPSTTTRSRCRPVLALRRHRLDLPVPAAVPDRPDELAELAGAPLPRAKHRPRLLDSARGPVAARPARPARSRTTARLRPHLPHRSSPC